jgi:hypothetical protein
MAKIIRYENIKHELTPKEKTELGERIAREVENVRKLGEEKKSVVAEYNSKIALANQNISKDSTILNNGHEFKSIECEIKMNTPKTGMKTIIPINRIDKKIVVPMLPHEAQEEIFDKDERKNSTVTADTAVPEGGTAAPPEKLQPKKKPTKER